MDQEAIKQILPHRDNMLLLDEAEKVEDTAHGIYHVRGNEFFLQGHFPGNPVVPGVILCEIMAQSACVLLQDQMAAGKTPMYTGLNNVRFKSPVRPGDTFETRCRITRAKPPFYFAEGQGYVGDRLCLKAEFSFAIVGE
ncbi:MAG: 3-hydroxyacyl-ACP dehydratase FabZ family protein [Faecousia sp.]